MRASYFKNSRQLILLAIEDVTDRRAVEREITNLLQQKETLLQEMQHRIGNSLQIIASILSLKARAVQSEDTRLHLMDAQQRVMSVAAVQQQLLASGHGGRIEISPYLARLCETLAASMTDDNHPISLRVLADAGTASSADAGTIGFLVTELVINAFKHPFIGERAAGRLVVAYEAADTGWRLAVSDNGIGTEKVHLGSSRTTSGLGTIIVEALAKQLGARVDTVTNSLGTTVSITNGAITHGARNHSWLDHPCNVIARLSHVIVSAPSRSLACRSKNTNSLPNETTRRPPPRCRVWRAVDLAWLVGQHGHRKTAGPIRRHGIGPDRDRAHAGGCCRNGIAGAVPGAVSDSARA